MFIKLAWPLQYNSFLETQIALLEEFAKSMLGKVQYILEYPEFFYILTPFRFLLKSLIPPFLFSTAPSPLPRRVGTGRDWKRKQGRLKVIL